MRDDLFQLIGSLTRSEKRYFTLHASMHRKDTRHLLLFKTIEKQKEYDEDALRRLFQEKGFTEQLSVAKNYLHRMIMKVLRSYHGEISQNAQVKDMLRDAEILMMKGLYGQSRKMLAKAAEIATANNFHFYLMEINYWKRQLLYWRDATNISSENLELQHEELYSEAERLINEMSMINTSRHTFDRLKHHGPLHAPGALEQLRNGIPEDIRNGTVSADVSYITRMNFLYARLHYLYVTCDFPEHYSSSLEFITLAENSTWRDAESSNHLLCGLDMLLDNLLSSGRYSEAAAVVEQFKAAGSCERTASQSPSPLQFFARHFEYQLRIDAGLGDFSTARARIPDILKNLEAEGGAVDEEPFFPLRFSFGIVCFGTRDFHGALRWIEPLLNYGPGDPSANWNAWYSVTRMLQLLIHYEIGNADVLDYMLKSYYRFLARKQHPYQTEELLLRFLKRVLRAPGRMEVQRELKSLATELRAIYHNPFERQIFSSLDILAWTESRIQGKTFPEILREYAGDGQLSVTGSR